MMSGGERIAVYLTPAEGGTFLNYFDVGHVTLDFAVDMSALKQSRHKSDTRLRICPPEELLEEMPDHCLSLTRNFADEAHAQPHEYRGRGGRVAGPYRR